MPWATMTAFIVNIIDEDPPGSLQEMGYDPRIGNPLGHTFELRRLRSKSSFSVSRNNG